MTRIYRCDRCGETFDNVEESRQLKFHDPRERSHPLADLCKGCHGSLREWWEQK